MVFCLSCVNLCGVFLGVGVFCYLLVWVLSVCIGVAVWFRTCALAHAPACGLAAQTDVGPGFDSTFPAKSIRSASHRTETWPALLKRAAL